MADRAHQMTDQIIAETERRLAAEYHQAAKEVEEKLNDYLRRYRKKDETWRKWVEEGKKTKEEYEQWRKGQLAVGKRWRDMKNQLAKDLRNTDRIAKAIINGETPRIYAINHAYGTFQIESSGHIDTSYTLYNREAMERIIRENPEMLPPPGPRMERRIAEGRAERWTRQKLQSDMMQGILQGDSIPELAKRISGNTERRNMADAVRYARTMATGAQNAGRYDSYRRARDMGIDLVIEWAATLDGRTRHAHREMHGQRTTVDEPFYTPDGFTILYPGQGGEDIPQREIWNCFVGDTFVSTDSNIERSYRHKYKGELVSIKTSCGVSFTCTPNHPILTPRGWIHANALNEGDNILITTVRELDSAGIDPNINHAPPRMKTIHQLLKMFPCERASGLSVDFHGDTATSNVEVVSKEGLLWNNGDSCISKPVDKFGFKNAGSLILGKCHLVPCFRGIYITALRFMGGGRKALSFFRRSLCHSNKHGFGTVARSNTCVSEYAINDLPTMTNIRSELIDGLAGKVFVDNVVAIDRKPSGLFCHVYNLQTENGYYFVGNSISQNGCSDNGNYAAIAKNCRCSLLAWVAGFEHETMRESDDVDDFDEWLNGHGDSREILSQWDTGNAIKMQYVRGYKNG